jgi:C4-dicarboxylate-specific signal transduction histidine kinase
LNGEQKRANADLAQENRDRRKAEEALRASEERWRKLFAHEVNQPLAGIVTNANACLRWLVGDSPNLAEARESVRRIIRDGTRAADVILRMRALLQKAHTAKERLDINEAIAEVVILTQSEVRRNKATLRVEPAADLPPVMGDRVQLQRVSPVPAVPRQNTRVFKISNQHADYSAS